MTDIHLEQRKAQMRARQAEEYARIERKAMRDAMINHCLDITLTTVTILTVIAAGVALGGGLSYMLTLLYR